MTKLIVKLLFVLLLIGALVGAFDVLAMHSAPTVLDTGSGTSYSSGLGVIGSVSADGPGSGMCPDGRPGC